MPANPNPNSFSAVKVFSATSRSAIAMRSGDQVMQFLKENSPETLRWSTKWSRNLPTKISTA